MTYYIKKYKEFLKNQNEKLDYFLDNCEQYNDIIFEKKLKEFLEEIDEELIKILEMKPINCTCRGNEPIFELPTGGGEFHLCYTCKKIII